MHTKSKKEQFNAIRANVKKEMAMPRMAKSARIAKLNLDTTRKPEPPSATMPGAVDKIVPSPSQPERVQIAIDEADHGYRNLCIENALTDKRGDDVRLKKGG
jgi:hypothetical protein